MNLQFVQQYWAVLAAGGLILALAPWLLFRAWGQTARGRLRARVRDLRRCEARHERLRRAADRMESKVRRLQARADAVPPRRLSEGGEALDDARALMKIAHDQVLVAQNLVRQVIVEEFPPKRHDALRARFLRDRQPDRKPFEFQDG